jgi:alpha-1,6-mannosyltransferase
MRIVQLANFHTPTSGGLRTVLDELGCRYVEAGHQVHRIVPAEHDDVVDVRGVREIRLCAPLLPGGGGYRIISDRSRVNELLRHVRPDAVELSDKSTLVGPAARRRRIGARVVALSHERIDGILAGRVPSIVPLHRIADLRNRQLVAASDAVVCASDFAATEFRRIGATSVSRVPLGVDLEVFSPAGRQPRSENAPIRLITVGRLSDEKQPARAIEVTRRLVAAGRPAILTLVGDGPLAERLRYQAQGLPVRFRGHVASRPAMARLIADADVCIAPCPVETFGLAALEALACATPVVVPASGALAELLDGGPSAGRIVDGTAADWAERAVAAVIDLVASGEIARQAARRQAERYSWRATAAAMLDLLGGEIDDEPTTERQRGANRTASLI